MSWDFSTAEELIVIKQERNNCLIDLLRVEGILLKKDMYMRQLIINFNEKRVDMIHKINEIEEKQKITYSLVRESDIAMLTNEVNIAELDLSAFKVDIIQLQMKYRQLLDQVGELNSKIPEVGVVTNVRIGLLDVNQTGHEAAQKYE